MVLWKIAIFSAWRAPGDKKNIYIYLYYSNIIKVNQVPQFAI